MKVKKVEAEVDAVEQALLDRMRSSDKVDSRVKLIKKH